MKTKAEPARPRYDALLQLLRTADTIWNASRSFFEQWGLSPSQFNVLNLLYSRPEGLSQTKLGHELIMHRSNVTGLTDRLEARGLVERKDVAADRRAYRVVLTKQGAALIRDILPRYYDAADRVWGELPLRRVLALVPELRLIAVNAEHIAAAMPHEPES